jgi:SpoVK/Ycf46/Vps4 family AAA+-type ATPase
MTAGYCGADIEVTCLHNNSATTTKISFKALVTEAILKAVRRTYPQIYEANKKLLIDPEKVVVRKRDFLFASKGRFKSHIRLLNVLNRATVSTNQK